MGRIFSVRSYWGEGQWGTVGPALESAIDGFCIIYDVFPPMGGLIGELGGRAAKLFWTSYFPRSLPS